MPKEEFVEGLKQAVFKGESLENAMMSFFNAGYQREDIEEAASVLQTPLISQSQFQQPKQKIPTATPSPPVVQRVSDYGQKPSKTGAIITIVLFSLLLILLGILAAVILFKDELSTFFSSLFLRALF